MFTTFWERVRAFAIGNVVHLPNHSIVFPDEKELIISDRQWTALPDSLACLTALCGLSVLGCNMITRLPDSVGQLVSLRVLCVSNCDAIRELPEALGQLAELTTLRIRGCSLTKLPESLGDLPALTSLMVADCQFEAFPTSMRRLRSLHVLRLEHCPRLAQLPECTTLQLDITRCNALTHAPALLFSKMEELRVYGRCGALDLRAVQFPYLRLLTCSYTHLPQLHIPSLRQLQIQACGSMERLPSLSLYLTHLYMSYCPLLSDLPDSLGQLAAMQVLGLLECHALLRLPESLGQLAVLRHLSIVGCDRLTCLPESIGRLSQLTVLDIEDCPRLRCLPSSFGQLTALDVLNIKGSPLNWLRSPLRLGGVASVLDLYQRHHAPPQVLVLLLVARTTGGRHVSEELWCTIMDWMNVKCLCCA